MLRQNFQAMPWSSNVYKCGSTTTRVSYHGCMFRLHAMTLLLLLAAIANARPEPEQADIAWIANDGFCEPETVLPLPDDTLLVSNVCDFRQAGNGFLTLLNAEGKTLTTVDGLDAPLGMALAGNRLYVVDSNRLLFFHWPSYEHRESIDLDTSVANDVAVTPCGVAYVTDTAKHRVLKVDADGMQAVVTGQAQFQGANGIEWHDGKLYVGGERLWRVDLASGSIEVIGPEWLSDIDGIEFEADGTLQITPVAGPLIRYRDETDYQVLGGEGVSSANHGYAPDLGLALIPTGFDNTVIAIRIND